MSFIGGIYAWHRFLYTENKQEFLGKRGKFTVYVWMG